MGGGDLNLKKSWHPATIHNQEKVWLAERRAEEEKKKMEQLLKEKKEEQEMQELLALQAAAGTGKKKKIDRSLDWMYTAGTQNQNELNEDREAYLLGTKKIDKLLDGKSNNDDLSANGGAFGKKNAMYGLSANTYRDTQNKIRDDPLLMIKKREQEALKRIMENPLRIKEIAKTDKKSKKKSKKEHDKKKKSKNIIIIIIIKKIVKMTVIVIVKIHQIQKMKINQIIKEEEQTKDIIKIIIIVTITI